MSGSGGGGFVAPNANPNCEGLVLRTHITPNDPEILQQLQVGQVLKVQLEGPGGPVVVMIEETNQIVGSVLAIEVLSIIQCITNGHEYIAEVRNLNGAECQVLIRHI